MQKQNSTVKHTDLCGWQTQSSDKILKKSTRQKLNAVQEHLFTQQAPPPYPTIVWLNFSQENTAAPELQANILHTSYWLARRNLCTSYRANPTTVGRREGMRKVMTEAGGGERMNEGEG